MPESRTANNAPPISLAPAMMHPAELNRRLQMIRMSGKPIGRSSRTTKEARRSEDWVEELNLKLELVRSGRAGIVMIDGPIWFDQVMALWMGGTASVDLVDVLDEAASDDTIDTVVLDINSPGGSVAGSHDVISAIRRCSAIKPVVALCHDMACSLGYWIAAECNRIYGTPTSETGSIGTIAIVYDTSAMAEKWGERAIPLTSGAPLKTLGQYGVPVADDMLGPEQAIIDAMGKDFRDAVVANRSIDEAALMAMKGAAYYGQSQIDMGLVDELIGTHEFYERLHAGTLDTGSKQSKTPSVGKADTSPGSPGEASTTNTQRTAMNDELKEQLAALSDEDKEEARSILGDGEETDEETASTEEDEETTASAQTTDEEDENTPSAMTIGGAKAFLKQQGITDTNMINALACEAVEKKMDKVDLLSAVIKAQRETDPEIAQEAKGSPSAIGGGRGASASVSGDGAIAKYHAAVKETMETYQLSKAKATAKVNREQQELSAAYIAEFNKARAG